MKISELEDAIKLRVEKYFPTILDSVVKEEIKRQLKSQLSLSIKGAVERSLKNK